MIRSLYVGTYTRGDSKGIYRIPVAGTDFGTPELAAETKNPSYLAIHPNGRTLYSVCEIAEHDGTPQGGVEAYERDVETGALRLLGAQPSGSKGPCYVSIDPAGEYAAVANYGGGSVELLRVAPDGALTEVLDHHIHEGSSVNSKRQAEAHAHSAVFDTTGAFLFVPDLGMDRVVCYAVDRRNDTLVPSPEKTVAAEPGSGPRHIIFHPSGTAAYLANELTSTVMSFAYSGGHMSHRQTLTMLPAEFSGENTAADIHLSNDGAYIFASNRGHDSLAIYQIGDDPTTLSPAGWSSTNGRTPRNFTVHPSEPIVLAANQDSDSITVFHYTMEEPVLTASGRQLEAPSPVCLQWA